MKYHQIAGISTLAWICNAVAVAAPLDIGSQRQLFVDRLIVGELKNATFKLGQPVPRESAVSNDRPWDGINVWPRALIREDGVLKLFYGTEGMNGLHGGNVFLAYALSADGIHWSKPDLGVAEWRGSKANNLIQGPAGGPLENNPYSIFSDPRPDVPKTERIKALYFRNLSDKIGAREDIHATLLVSADGIRFKESGIPIQLTSTRKDAFDGYHIFWSEAERQFVGYIRWYEEVPVDGLDMHPLFRGPKGSKKHMRTVFRTTSKDLIHWTDAQSMSWEGPREDIYRDDAYPYFRAPQIYIGIANRFFEARNALDAAELAQVKFAPVLDADGKPYDFTHDANDIVLLATRPGTTVYTRLFMESFVRPGTNPGNWTSRDNYCDTTTFQTGPDEMSFLVTRHHCQDDPLKVQRFSLRLDGFASVNAPYAGGEMVTVPLVFSGDRLELNYSTSAAGQIRLEIQDADGLPFPGFALEDSAVLIGDRIAGEARWRSGTDVGSLAGKTVRLRFEMRDSDLYSSGSVPPPTETGHAPFRLGQGMPSGVVSRGTGNAIPGRRPASHHIPALRPNLRFRSLLSE